MIDTTEAKVALEAELVTITKDLQSIAVQDESTGDWVAIPAAEELGNADDNVEADVNEEWTERDATTAALETRYRNLVRALEKITAGTYGICELSGEVIEPERLAANPAARTCITHMEREGELTV